jgi:hypothetical protein
MAEIVREIGHLKALIGTRLDGIDAATELSRSIVNRVPSEVDRQVEHLKELQDEKFRSMESMIAQRFLDNQKAVDAAFAAQKEAVAEQNKSIGLANDKSEVAFTKQQDALTVLLATTNRATDEKVNDLKARLDRGEGKTGGVASSYTFLIGGLLALAAVVTAIIAIVNHL